VEDNTVNQRVLQRHLEGAGLICDIANNGFEAVQFTEQLSFDLVFMDIEMPVMNGLEATRLIRVRESTLQYKAVPIVGLSGNARQEHIDTAISSGMNDYIVKPYDKESLLSVVNKFVL